MFLFIMTYLKWDHLSNSFFSRLQKLRRHPHLIVLIPILTFSLSLSLAAEAKMHASKIFQPHNMEALFQYGSIHSISNFNAKSLGESLPGANSFWHATNYNFIGRYVFDHEFAVHFDLNYVQVQANVGDFTKFSESLQTLSTGIEKRLNARTMDIILEGVAQLSLFNVNEKSTRPIIGDGAHGFGGNIWFMQRVWSTIYWHARSGILFRTEGLSGLLPYQAGIHWQSDELTLSTLWDGYFSITPDSKSENDRRTFLNRSSVGSYQYRSANPSLGTLNFQAKWNATEQFNVFAEMGKTLVGRNSGQETHFFIGAGLNWQTSPQYIETNPLKNTLPSK